MTTMDDLDIWNIDRPDPDARVKADSVQGRYLYLLEEGFDDDEETLECAVALAVIANEYDGVLPASCVDEEGEESEDFCSRCSDYMVFHAVRTLELEGSVIWNVEKNLVRLTSEGQKKVTESLD